MNTRCKPGDLAIITCDVPQCTANIGRVVEISGPARYDRNGRITWLIQPVTLEPYLINNWDDTSVRFMDYREEGIEQPDDWLLPIRPEKELDEVDDLEEVSA
jgi:hypothetical protein